MSRLRSFFIARWPQPEDARRVRFQYVYMIPGAMVALHCPSSLRQATCTPRP